MNPSALVPVLGVVALVVLVYLLLLARGRLSSGRAGRGRKGIRFPSERRARRLKRLTVVLIVGAVACLGVALAQFRLSSHRVSEGTVILVMDASQSMERTDVEPSRLAAAQAAARAFLAKLPEDFRVGLVTFAGDATVRIRPTVDREQVVASFDALTTDNGTVIGDGLAAALDTLREDWSRNGEGPAAVLLLSDGLDTGSFVPPERAAERARSLGVPVFTVAVGKESEQEGGANIPLLRQMAERTGGSTFTAVTSAELTRVYETLGSRLSYELAVNEFAGPFVVAAVLLGIAAAVTLLLSMRSRF